MVSGVVRSNATLRPHVRGCIVSTVVVRLGLSVERLGLSVGVLITLNFQLFPL